MKEEAGFFEDRVQPVSCWVLVILALLLMLLPQNPYSNFLGNDSGVFLYTASLMKEGGIPYVDSWDHKGPFIYFIDLLGISIPPNQQWGLFILQILLVLGGCVFFIHEVRKESSWAAVLSGLACFLYAWPKTFGGGNQVEFYSSILLLFSFAFYLTATHIGKNNSFFFLGILGAVVCFTRINNAAFWAVLGVLLLFNTIRDWRKNWQKLFLFLAGLALVGCITLGYLWRNGALPDFIDQYLRYNFFYSSISSGFTEKIQSVFTNYRDCFGIFFCFWTLFILVVILLIRFQHRNGAKGQKPQGFSNLLSLALLSFPLDFLLSGLSGRSYAHYLAMLPVYLFFFSTVVIERYRRRLLPECKHGKLLTAGVFCGFFILFAFLSKDSLSLWTGIQDKVLSQAFYNTYRIPEEVILIDENTEPEDTVLIWGGDTRYNYLSGRKSPTRYSYPFILMQCNYATEGRWWEFYHQFISDPPEIILEMKNLVFPPGWSIPDECSACAEPMEKFFLYLDENYWSAPSNIADVDDVFFRKE